jgi:hypothetical protein
LINRASGFPVAQRSLPHHSDLAPGATQPYRHRQYFDFVARVWRHCGCIEQCMGSRQAETDVDLVDRHLDPFNQGSEDSTLAGNGQLGPVIAEICGSRDKPLLP